ncbi:MAG: hypothetical protein OXR66_08090 [Candidatus Woesearchaeota archaeon]|nr:hypothetical protein [Candidatus Woesearchaeota archaeon]
MRGQAAMEFIMTYGWALLAIIAAIGVMSYFGVFSGGKLPEKCIATTGFTCADYLLSKWDASVNQCEVAISLVNNMGYDITIVANSTEVICDNCEYNPDQQYRNNCYWWRVGTKEDTVHHVNLIPNGHGSEVFVPAGKRMTMECNSGSVYYVNFPEAGMPGKLKFRFLYRKAGGTYNHTAEGEITARVEEQVCGQARCLYPDDISC